MCACHRNVQQKPNTLIIQPQLRLVSIVIATEECCNFKYLIMKTKTAGLDCSWSFHVFMARAHVLSNQHNMQYRGPSLLRLIRSPLTSLMMDLCANFVL